MKRLALIGAGGTIAGTASGAGDCLRYRAGALGVRDLLDAVPTLGELAEIVPEDAFAIDSKDATPAHWLVLARRVRAALADPAIDGVVVTHGTDTLEECAYFLHLTLPVGKPVVFTGAMRPATALSADGPMNLHQAVAVAASGVSAACGVVLVINGEIHGAREVAKTHTLSLAAFASPNGGPLGRAELPTLDRQPLAVDAGALPLATLRQVDPLPEVALLMVASGVSPDFLQTARAGSAGLVLALPGHGSVPAAWRERLDRVAGDGWPVVRASRVASGPVLAEGDDFPWAAGGLSALKARVALIAALAAGDARHFLRLR